MEGDRCCRRATRGGLIAIRLQPDDDVHAGNLQTSDHKELLA